MDYNCFKHPDRMGSMLIGNKVLCGECIKKFFEKKQEMEQKILNQLLEEE